MFEIEEQVNVMTETYLLLSEIHMDMGELFFDLSLIGMSMPWCPFFLEDLCVTSVDGTSLVFFKSKWIKLFHPKTKFKKMNNQSLISLDSVRFVAWPVGNGL